MRRMRAVPALLLVSGLLAAAPGVTRAADEATLSGTLSVIWGDPAPDVGGGPQLAFFLQQADSRTVALSVPADMARTLSLLGGRQVTVYGTPAAAAEAAGAGSLAVSSYWSPQAESAAEPLLGPQPFVSVMCKFNDVATEPHAQSYFQSMYDGTYPRLDHYWREASENQMNIAGSGAFGWFTLPQPRSYYVYNMDSDPEPEADLTRLANDCVQAGDASIYYPGYAGINLMFNGNLDCCAWGGGMNLNVDGVNRHYPVTWEPPWGYANISVIAHEMGHGLGLPHSSCSTNVYDNLWDVMSSDGLRLYHSGGCTKIDPAYGCVPQHPIATYKDREGWIAAGNKLTVTSFPAAATLTRLALPGAGYRVLDVPVSGGKWTVEARRQVGYDAVLHGNGVIVHKVPTGQQAWVHDADGDCDTSNANFGVCQSFRDSKGRLYVTVMHATGTGYRVSLTRVKPYKLAGLVRTKSLLGIPRVTMRITGPVSATVSSGARGSFSVCGLPPGTYTVRPARAGYLFSRASRVVTITASDRTGVNFYGSRLY